MEALFKAVAEYVALGLEGAAVFVIALGALQTLYRALLPRRSAAPLGRMRDAWIRFAAWLLLGLEFALAADIVRSAISPSWNDIGQLAAIAAIRTVLNLFLERDIEKATARDRSSAAGALRELEP